MNIENYGFDVRARDSSWGISAHVECVQSTSRSLQTILTSKFDLDEQD